MKLKKYIISSTVAVLLSPVITLGITNSNVQASEITSSHNDQVIRSYESSLKLPDANIQKDIYGNGTMFRSASNPNSIQDYKKLGYKNIKYTKWNTMKMLSSRQKAVARSVALSVVGLIPGKTVAALTAAFSLGSAMKSPEAYVWPTSTVRNILATSPRGTEVIIGQQVIIRYYSNSSRTKLIKTVRKTYWTG